MVDRGDDVTGRAEVADRVEEIADSLEHGYNDYAVSVLHKAARRLRGGEDVLEGMEPEPVTNLHQRIKVAVDKRGPYDGAVTLTVPEAVWVADRLRGAPEGAGTSEGFEEVAKARQLVADSIPDEARAAWLTFRDHHDATERILESKKAQNVQLRKIVNRLRSGFDIRGCD